MENGPFIDGLPSYKMVICHGYVSHNQMVKKKTGFALRPSHHDSARQ
jgi:hypothetical protein